MEKHKQQHNCSACPTYQKSCFRQLQGEDLTCHQGRCSPRVYPSLQCGTPEEKPLRHRHLSLHCHVITGENSQLIFLGHLLVSEVTLMRCSKFIGETPTFFLILSSLKGANLALQQPIQHRYRLQRDPRAHRAFIHVEYGHHRSHKQGLHSHKLVPLSKRRIGRLCADTSGNKLFCFLKA